MWCWVRRARSLGGVLLTDPGSSVASILETVADRSALEQVFHDVKEVHGAGQQQLRHVWANVGAWNLIGWWHTLVELWAWDRPQSRLRDRSDSPWDKPERRPSHANRCQELRREALQEEYSSLPSVAGLRPKIRRFIQRPHAGSHEADSSGKVQTMRRHGAKNADYRGGVTCLYDTQLLGTCLHASECGGRYRPQALRGMPEVPIAPPATGPPEGWAAVGLVSPASFNRGLWGAFA